MRLTSLLRLAATAGASTVLQLNTTSYYSPDLVAATLDFGNEPLSITEVLLITYLSSPEAATAESLKSSIVSFLADDDVYSESFLSTLVLGGSSTLAEEVDAYLFSIGCIEVHIASDADLNPVPYLLHSFYRGQAAFR